MKRSVMKSNIALQARCRPEGRLFPRRKVAAKASFLNGVGDFDMELSLAIKESLKYVQQDNEVIPKENGFVTNTLSENDNKHDIVPDFVNNTDVQRTNKAVTSKPNIASMAAPSSDSASEEVTRLKDLVLSQAELIQCQQDEIAKKDEELRALRSVNDALQCRLDRMERRMSILKHKEDIVDVSGSQFDVLPIKNATHLMSPSLKRQNEVLKMEYRKRRRHKLFFNQRKTHKSQNILQNKSSLKEANFRHKQERKDSEEEDKYYNLESEEEQENNIAKESESSEINNIENSTPLDNEKEVLQELKIVDYPIMQTESLYHLYYPRHVLSSPEAKKMQDEMEVETPSWRLKPVTNLYQLEGTENITDEAYNKRHQKFELEEKRRKRWDLQRLRELRQLEKLQQQREDEMRASQDEADVDTFLPSVHDLKYIEITNLLPVMAFGQPVPYVSPAEFEVPWEMSTSGQGVLVNRQKNNNLHTKKQ